MKFKSMFAAGLIAMAAAVSSVPAVSAQQNRHQHSATRSVHTARSTGPHASRQAKRHATRHHRTRRVCKLVYRNHHRARVCHTVRY